MSRPGIKNLITMNFLYSFLSAALALLLPIYLIDRGMNIAEVGAILSILPLITIFARTTLAIIADIIGTRFIFILSGISNIAALAVYAFASVPFMFSFGKVLEGLSISAFWAVNRTEIYRTSEGRGNGNTASLMLTARMAADFLARISVGFAIALLGFFNTFSALFIVVSVYLFHSFKLRDLPPEVKEKITLSALKKRIFAKRRKEFWHVASLAFFSAPLDLLVTFLFPIYLLSRFLMSPAEIGILIGLYALFYTFGAFFCTKYDLNPIKCVFLSFALIVLPLLVITYVDHIFVYFLIILIGLGAGFEGFVYEHLIAHGTKLSRSVSTDIAIIHIPFKLAEVLSYTVLGMLVYLFDFSVGFVAIGMMSTIFCFAAYLFFKKYETRSSS